MSGQRSGNQACIKSTVKWGIVVTSMRPDMVLYSEGKHTVYFTKLTIPFEDVIEEAFERKTFKYVEFSRNKVGKCRQNQWIYSILGFKQIVIGDSDFCVCVKEHSF